MYVRVDRGLATGLLCVEGRCMRAQACVAATCHSQRACLLLPCVTRSRTPPCAGSTEPMCCMGEGRAGGWGVAVVAPGGTRSLPLHWCRPAAAAHQPQVRHGRLFRGRGRTMPRACRHEGDGYSARCDLARAKCLWGCAAGAVCCGPEVLGSLGECLGCGSMKESDEGEAWSRVGHSKQSSVRRF